MASRPSAPRSGPCGIVINEAVGSPSFRRKPESTPWQDVDAATCIDAFAVSLGFAVLMLSQVPSNARLGGLLVASLATATLAAFVVLPALYKEGSPRLAEGRSG